MFNSRTILKYLAIHVSELAAIVGALVVLRSFVHVPALVVVMVPGLWILKDIVLYPWVWRAYAYPDTNPLSELLGKEATVVQTLDPEGFVRVHGELWKARLTPPGEEDGQVDRKPSPLERGGRARVVGTRGNMLLVEPLPAG